MGQAQGQWRGKALVRDQKSGKQAVLEVDVLAQEPSRLRMELTGAFGTHIGSLVLNGDQVSYLLTQEKRFITGPAGADALIHLVPIRIPPTALMAVLFERSLPASDWSCEQGEDQLPRACTHRSEPVTINWLQRQGRSRRLRISAAEASIELVLDEAKSNVESNQNPYVLTPPAGYKHEQIRSSSKTGTRS